MYKFWILILSLAIPSSAYDEADLAFLRDFTSHNNFYSNLYNLIVCQKSERINPIKMLSGSFRRFVAVRGPDEALRPFGKEPQTFVLSLRCERARAVLEEAERFQLFERPFRWLLLTDDLPRETGNVSEGGETSFWTFLQTLTVLSDSDLKLAERKAEGKFSVTGAYKISGGGGLIEEPLAEWTPAGGLSLLDSRVPVIRRWNLRGAALPSTMVITHQDSLNHLEDLVDKHIDTTSKVCYNMIKLLEDVFNMSVTMKIGHEWGIYKNGSWTGMVGELERREIEFGSSPLFLQKERLHILEYYTTVTPARGRFLFLSPPLSYSSNIFVLPFDQIVWLCCLGTFAISCCLLYAALKFENSHATGGVRHPNVSFTEVLVLNIGAICLQGTVARTSHPPGRIITLFLYLSYMFLYISYSAAIVAILQSSDTSIRNFQDFINSPLQGGADDVVYSQYYFKNVKEEVRRTIYLKKIAPKGEPPHFLPLEEGIKRVRKGFYAYHVEQSSGYLVIQKTFTEEEKCALQEIEGDYFQTMDVWLVMRRGSPFTEHFKIGMMRSIEKGFKSRFVQRYFTKKPVCSAKAARFVSVGIFDCYYAYILLSAGVALSLLVLLTEFGFSKFHKRQEKHKLIETSHFAFIN